MTRIFVPSTGAEAWRGLLADPRKQWKKGYSARTLAYAWESARGWPSEVKRVLSNAEETSIRDLELLFALPEYKVPLPGGSRASQSDLFVIARGREGLITIAVEGKVNEDFGPHVDEWLAKASEGKKRRWAFIDECLRLKGVSGRGLRYQLFHRFASAVVEARRLQAMDAMMLVHAFGTDRRRFDEFAAFVEIFGRGIKPNQVLRVDQHDGDLRLHTGWITGARRHLDA